MHAGSYYAIEEENSIKDTYNAQVDALIERAETFAGWLCLYSSFLISNRSNSNHRSNYVAIFFLPDPFSKNQTLKI